MIRRLVIIDVIAAVIYLLAANPLITGLAVHEWISLGCIIVFVVHCAVHHDWFIALVHRRIGKSGVAHLVLDSLTLIVFMVVTVSGLMVSRYILPLMDLVAPGYFFWNPIHSMSAKIFLALLLIHIVVHAPWFSRVLFKRGKKAAN